MVRYTVPLRENQYLLSTYSVRDCMLHIKERMIYWGKLNDKIINWGNIFLNASLVNPGSHICWARILPFGYICSPLENIYEI